MNKLNDFLFKTLFEFLFRTLSKANDLIKGFQEITVSDILANVTYNSFNDEGVFSFRS